MSFFYKLTTVIQNLNIIVAIKVFFVILFKNYSKYPKYLNFFENSAKKYFNSDFVLTFSSGSAAFYASVKSLNLKPNSRVLISTMTFPSVVKILSNLNYEIIFYEIDQNFQPINLKKNNFQDINLIIVTHPFGFFSDFKNLDQIKNHNTKMIFDCSHTHGLNVEGKNINNFCDIAFLSLQGNKAISGGEGGLVLTNNNEYYKRMVNSHHPNHTMNDFSDKYTGVSNDLKLRMHPIASLIALGDLNKLDSRNKILIDKFYNIYQYLETVEYIDCPKFDKKKSAGFHYGLPFFLKKKEKLNWPIIKYNWPITYTNEFEPTDDIELRSIFSKLYFIDLNWIKKKPVSLILKDLKKIFKK